MYIDFKICWIFESEFSKNIFTFTYPLTAGVVGAQQMTSPQMKREEEYQEKKVYLL